MDSWIRHEMAKRYGQVHGGSVRRAASVLSLRLGMGRQSVKCHGVVRSFDTASNLGRSTGSVWTGVWSVVYVVVQNTDPCGLVLCSVSRLSGCLCVPVASSDARMHFRANSDVAFWVFVEGSPEIRHPSKVLLSTTQNLGKMPSVWELNLNLGVYL